jgi:ferric-dicitrate binding protein FerR (iron transport regulator)
MRTSLFLRGAVALAAALLLPAAAWAVKGSVTYTEGIVTLRSGGASREAAIGDELAPGDVVVTGPRSLAILDLANGTTLKLRESTTLSVDSIGDATSVSLAAGGVFTNIARKLSGTFNLRASNTVAGVRGTRFFVAYGRTIDELPDIWLCVDQGSVQVDLPSAGQSVLVPAGKGVNILAGAKITTPRPFPWTRKLNWNADPAAGDVEDATSLEQAYSDLLDQDYD